MRNSTVFDPNRKYHLTLEERTALMVLARKNHSDEFIAKAIKCSINTVERWKRRTCKNNVKGQGRKPIFSNRLKRKLSKKVKLNKGRFTARLLSKFNSRRRRAMSYSTAVRALKKSGGVFSKPKTGSILTTNQKTQRLKCAKANVNTNWKQVWFHHESFYSLDNQNFKVWNFPDTPLVKTQKHFTHLKFEPFVSREGKTDLFFFTRRRNGQHLRNLLPLFKTVFKEKSRACRFRRVKVFFDQASSHTPFARREEFAQSFDDFEFFPPPPCELNVIERVWAILKNAVRARTPKTLTVARKYLIEEWSKISRQTLRKIFDSIPNRVKSVIISKGDKTEYWSKDKN